MLLEAHGQSPRVPQYVFQSAALARALQGVFPQREELQPARESSVIPFNPRCWSLVSTESLTFEVGQE